jgi:hypothetical protein
MASPPTPLPRPTQPCCTRPAPAAGPIGASITRKLDVDAIYGAFSLLGGHYLAVVTASSAIAAAPTGAPIRQVQEMEWLLVGQGVGPRLSPAEAREEAVYLGLLRGLARSGLFYFCFGYDLSQCAQRIEAAAAEATAEGSGGDADNGQDFSDQCRLGCSSSLKPRCHPTCIR